jgi:hypothetical protein
MILIGALFLVYFLNTTSDIFYRYGGGEHLDLFLKEENINYHMLSMPFFAFGMVSIYIGSMFFLDKFFSSQNKITTKKYIIKEIVFSIFAMYLVFYVAISTLSPGEYNESYKNGNTPLFLSNNTQESFLVSKNGLILKQYNYFDNIIEERLNFSENQFLSMIEGTFLSYSNVIKTANLDSFTIDEHIWLYKTHIESYKKVYDKRVSAKGYKETKRNELYRTLLESELPYYTDLNQDNYLLRKSDCLKENIKYSISFCATNLVNKNKITIKRLKFLQKKYNLSKMKPIKEEIATIPEIYNLFINK